MSVWERERERKKVREGAKSAYSQHMGSMECCACGTVASNVVLHVQDRGSCFFTLPTDDFT